jgi:hypothetical protein
MEETEPYAQATLCCFNTNRQGTHGPSIIMRGINDNQLS